MHWLIRVSELLLADTINLRRLAILAEGDPAIFYRGADLTNADFRGQDLRGISFEGAILAGVLVDSETVMDRQLLFELERQGVSTHPIEAHGIDDDHTARREQYPTIPLRNQVVFPHMIVPFIVGREKSIASVREVTRTEKQIFLVSQRIEDDDEPDFDAIYTMGVLATVLQHMDQADGTVKVLIEATARAKVKRFAINDHYFEANIECVPDEIGAHDEIEALARSTTLQFGTYAKLNNRISPQALVETASHIHNYSKLADTIASHLTIKTSEKQEILEITTASGRLERIYMCMENEIVLLQEEKKIRSRADRRAKASMAKLPFDRVNAILKELATVTVTAEPTFHSAKSTSAQIYDRLEAQAVFEKMADAIRHLEVGPKYDSKVLPWVWSETVLPTFPVAGYAALADLLQESLVRKIPKKQEVPAATTVSEQLDLVKVTARLIFRTLSTQLEKHMRRPYLNELAGAIQEELDQCQVDTRLYDHLDELMKDTQTELEGLDGSEEVQMYASQSEYYQLERLEGLVRELKKRIDAEEPQTE